MPFKKENYTSSTMLKASLAPTVYIEDYNNLYYAKGLVDKSMVHLSNLNVGVFRLVLMGILKVIMDIKCNGKLLADDELFVFVKPLYTATTDQMIQMLDELRMAEIKTFVIDDLNDVDISFLKSIICYNPYLIIN